MWVITCFTSILFPNFNIINVQVNQKLRYLENKVKRVARGDGGADELRQLVLKHKLWDIDQRTELPASRERVHRTQQRKYHEIPCEQTFCLKCLPLLKLTGGFFATQAKRQKEDKTVLRTINTKRCARPEELSKTKSKIQQGLDSAPGDRVWWEPYFFGKSKYSCNC